MSDILKITTDEFFIDSLEAANVIGQETVTNGQLIAHLCAGSASDIAQRVRRCKIRKLEWKDISSDGYTSRIYRVILHLGDNDNDDNTVSFLIKSFSFQRFNEFVKEFLDLTIADMQPEKRLALINKFGEIHDAECMFYEIFTGSKCDVQLISFPLAKTYYTERITYNADQIPTGFIIMEDLTESVYIKNMAEGLNERQVRQIVDALVNFHAALLCDKKESSEWKHKISAANIMVQSEEILGGFMKISKTNCDNFDKDVLLLMLKRLSKIRTPDFFKYVDNVVFKRLGLPLLVCHGDMWSNNLLWKQENGKDTDELVAIIDWQVVHLGNSMEDFARFLVTSCDAEIRHSVESWLISYYFQRLSKLVGEREMKLDFSAEALQEAYDYDTVVQASFSAFIIEPMHQSFMQKLNDEELVMKQTRRLIDRSIAAMSDAIRILELKAPEWLTETN